MELWCEGESNGRVEEVWEGRLTFLTAHKKKNSRKWLSKIMWEVACVEGRDGRKVTELPSFFLPLLPRGEKKK